jgi:hypothetical protein
MKRSLVTLAIVGLTSILAQPAMADGGHYGPKPHPRPRTLPGGKYHIHKTRGGHKVHSHNYSSYHKEFAVEWVALAVVGSCHPARRRSSPWNG